MSVDKMVSIEKRGCVEERECVENDDVWRSEKVWRREDLKRVCAIIFTSARGIGSIFFMTYVTSCHITAYSE